MDPKKRTTRASPATTTTTTTPVTNAQLKASINQGVSNALAARDADRSMNGDDNHNSRMGVRRQAHLAYDRQVLPKGEIKKLEVEMWNLKVKGTDEVSYNQRFQELALMCVRMFPEESDKIEKYVNGLPIMIYGSVMASKPKTMQDAIEFETELMDKKISTLAKRQAENKRKLDNNNQAQQQPPKKQDCSSPATANNQRNPTCYESGNQGRYKSDCPELKNQNHGNQAGGTGAQGMVHASGGGETNQDLNNMEDDINALTLFL
nr:reverse transcriptase domain-containing protein [Tanacetum cinerariifolium]